MHESCDCLDLKWSCSKSFEGSRPSRLSSNTTDLVFDISGESANQWILQTHFEFLQNR